MKIFGERRSTIGELRNGNAVALQCMMTDESEEWKKLCNLVADEVDPNRLTELLEQLIGALDARKEQLEAPRIQRKPLTSQATGIVNDGD